MLRHGQEVLSCAVFILIHYDVLGNSFSAYCDYNVIGPSKKSMMYMVVPAAAEHSCQNIIFSSHQDVMH